MVLFQFDKEFDLIPHNSYIHVYSIRYRYIWSGNDSNTSFPDYRLPENGNINFRSMLMSVYGVVVKMELASTSASSPLRPKHYRIEINKMNWEVPERYQDLSPVGIGAFGAVW